MSTLPVLWALPLSAAMLLGAWQVWPLQKRAWAWLSLLLALASAWAPSPVWAVTFTGLCIASVWLTPADWFGEALALPLIFGALIRARLAWFPQIPEALAVWGGLAALVVVCLASQGMVATEGREAKALSLLVGQAAWASFGLLTGSLQAPLAWTGLLGLLWQQPLLRLPLSRSIFRGELPPWRTALLFLGLGGCLGFSGFSAYFQLFVPLMGQAGSGGMHAKLADSAGWMAAVAMLAVLVQTCAFGYFYWREVLVLKSAEAPRRFWPWIALGLSFAWAMHSNAVSGLALNALQSITSTGPIPSS